MQGTTETCYDIERNAICRSLSPMVQPQTAFSKLRCLKLARISNAYPIPTNYLQSLPHSNTASHSDCLCRNSH